MQNVLIVIHVIISVILIAIVLLQHGKQQGLSGSIAGGAETFFGKNKGRTIDAMLRKFTSVFAALFIISSVTLALVTVNEQNKLMEELQQTEESEAAAGEEAVQVSMDEEGNLVDANGNIIMTSEQVAEQQAAENAETENAEAETETAE